MPRHYTLGKRAGAKADTRARIVAAAIAIYRDRGMAAASTRAVAHAADVAPATVRNHFQDPGQLAAAVFEAVLAELRPPSQTIFVGVDDLAARIRRLAFELAAFYERGQPWWRVFEREPELIQAWSGGVDRYYADVEDLMRAALGSLASDTLALAVVAAVIGPPSFFALRARGLSSDQAAELGLELALPWLEARLASSRGGSRPVSSREE